MNKIAIIALATLLVVGISYQVKRTFHSANSSNDGAHNSTPGSADRLADGAAEQNNTSGENKTTTSQTAGNEAGTSSTLSTNNNAGVTANGANTNAGAGAVGSTHAHESADTSESHATGAQSGMNTSVNPDDDATADGSHETSAAKSASGHTTAAAQGPAHTSRVSKNAQKSNAEGADPGADSEKPVATTDKKSAKASASKAKENCFAFEFRHKKDSGEQDIENFLDHTNAFPITHADYNPKSLCVKVNQKAVSYQVSKYKQSPEVRVGALVGPESVIRVSYCVGKVSPCHEKCEQPKKRFMDELMSENADDDSFSDSWGKENADKAKKDLKNKAKELRAIASENDHLNEGSIQRDWESLQNQEWVCK